MSSCFSRCLRVPIAMRRFYEQSLWIPQKFLFTNLDLHHGLLDVGWLGSRPPLYWSQAILHFAPSIVPTPANSLLLYFDRRVLPKGPGCGHAYPQRSDGILSGNGGFLIF